MRIDFDRIKEDAIKGIRRSAVFMGLGVNAANDDRFSDYQLSHETKLQILPDGLNEETVKSFKNHYSEWVRVNAFRESIESFHVFLDQLFLALSIVKRKFHSVEEAHKYCAKFEGQGFGQKLSDFDKEFSINVLFPHCLLALHKARNCIAHRRGIVSNHRDINDKDAGSLRVVWRAMTVVMTDSNGEKTLRMHDLPGYKTTEETAVGIRFEDRNRSFRRGEVISFDPIELSEMLYYWMFEIDQLFKAGLKYAENKGVKFVQPESNKPVQPSADTPAD